MQPTSLQPPFGDIALDDAEGLVRAAVERFREKLTISCSFGGAGGMVLLDMAVKVDPKVDVFVLDTDVLFPETYENILAIEKKYGIHVRRARAAITLEEQALQHGDRLWERNPDACCAIRKVEPMRKAVEGYDAWITAIRRDQSQTRADAKPVTWDRKFKLWKIAPLVAWDEPRVLNYIFNHDVPVNALLEQGYTSIGCTHCTRKPAAGGGRTGRWAGLGKVECGIHTTNYESLGSMEGEGAAAPAPAVPATLTVHGEDPRI